MNGYPSAPNQQLSWYTVQYGTVLPTEGSSQTDFWPFLTPNAGDATLGRIQDAEMANMGDISDIGGFGGMYDGSGDMSSLILAGNMAAIGDVTANPPNVPTVQNFRPLADETLPYNMPFTTANLTAVQLAQLESLTPLPGSSSTIAPSPFQFSGPNTSLATGPLLTANTMPLDRPLVPVPGLTNIFPRQTMPIARTLLPSISDSSPAEDGDMTVDEDSEDDENHGGANLRARRRNLNNSS